MTVNQSVELMVYGLAVLGLNLVVHRMAPDSAGGTLIPLVAGGGLITVLFGLVVLHTFCVKRFAH